MISLSEKIFSFRGIKEPLSSDDSSVRQSLMLAKELVSKVSGLAHFVMENHYTFLRSLAKFSFISQRIFIYLIFEGFCGLEDKDEDDKQEQEN